MTRVIASLYDRPGVADQVMRALYGAGFDRSQVECVESGPEGREVHMRGAPMDDRVEVTDSAEISQRLKKIGISDDDADHFARELRRGKSLVVLRSDDEMSGRAKHIMNRYPVEEMEEESTLDERWTGTRTHREASGSGGPTDLEILESIAEEKEEEDPVERGSNPDKEDGQDAPSEIEIFTDADEPEEQPEEAPAPSTDSPFGELAVSRAQQLFQLYKAEFRRHYEEHYAALKKYSFEEYSRAYRYGLALAQDSTYRHHTWPTAEADARRQWKSLMKSPWSEFREAVRFGWYQLRGEEEKYAGRPRQS